MRQGNLPEHKEQKRERIDPLQRCLAGLKGRTWRISFWELHTASTSFSGSLVSMASIARHHAVWGRESFSHRQSSFLLSYGRNRIAAHCRTASAALARRIASSLLLIGCGITANGNPGMPDTWAMAWAVCTKRSVMIAVAVIPAFSAAMASCTLHDEQLPQSPTAEMTAAHGFIAAMTSGGAGRLASGFLKRSTWATPY
jgi:hypothetical protein